jgi:hypothetical protein
MIRGLIAGLAAVALIISAVVVPVTPGTGAAGTPGTGAAGTPGTGAAGTPGTGAAGTSSTSARKGDRLDLRPASPVDPACSRQAWPYYDGQCIRAPRKPTGPVLPVRVVSADRLSGLTASLPK